MLRAMLSTSSASILKNDHFYNDDLCTATDHILRFFK